MGRFTPLTRPPRNAGRTAVWAMWPAYHPARTGRAGERRTRDERHRCRRCQFDYPVPETPRGPGAHQRCWITRRLFPCALHWCASQGPVGRVSTGQLSSVLHLDVTLGNRENSEPDGDAGRVAEAEEPYERVRLIGDADADPVRGVKLCIRFIGLGDAA